MKHILLLISIFLALNLSGQTFQSVGGGSSSQNLEQLTDTSFYITGTNDTIVIPNQILSISNDTIYLKNGGFVVLQDNSSSNELQNLTQLNDTSFVISGTNDTIIISSSAGTDDQIISISNDTIYLEDGGFIVLPQGGADFLSLACDTSNRDVVLTTNDYIFRSLLGSAFGLDTYLANSFTTGNSNLSELDGNYWDKPIDANGDLDSSQRAFSFITFPIESCCTLDSFEVLFNGVNLSEGDTINFVFTVDSVVVNIVDTQPFNNIHGYDSSYVFRYTGLNGGYNFGIFSPDFNNKLIGLDTIVLAIMSLDNIGFQIDQINIKPYYSDCIDRPLYVAPNGEIVIGNSIEISPSENYWEYFSFLGDSSLINKDYSKPVIISVDDNQDSVRDVFKFGGNIENINKVVDFIFMDKEDNEWLVGIYKPNVALTEDRWGGFTLVDTQLTVGRTNLGLVINQYNNTIALGRIEGSKNIIVGDYSSMTAEMQYDSYVFWNDDGVGEYAEISLDGISLPKFTAANRPTLGGSDFKSIYCTDCTATDTSTGVIQTWNGATWKNHW